jgi:threonyl-tRNA synthetase
LAPVQAVAVPVADEFADYLGEVVGRMKAAGIRAELDASDDRMQKKIRNHTLHKVPYIVIAGEEDRANNAVSFRFRNGDQENGIPVEAAIARIVDAIASRSVEA